MNDQELNLQLKKLVANERTLLTEILYNIAEIDRRKLFLRMRYPSLFEYLVKEIGYSAGSAQRRIDAARLMLRVPELAQKIERDAISLAQISKMQRACRQVRKESGKTVGMEVQRSVLEKMQGAGEQKTDLILAQEFNVVPKVVEPKSTATVEVTLKR